MTNELDEQSPLNNMHAHFPMNEDLITSPSYPLYDPAIPLPPAIGLVGRDDLLSVIMQQLFSGSRGVPIVALNGLPGVGKTAIASTLARHPYVRDYFSDGVLWNALGPKPNIPGLFNRWGKLLGLSTDQIITLKTSEGWMKALHILIGQRRMLLVIDDVWMVEHGFSFKIGGPNCAYLVTTRFPFIAAYLAMHGAMTVEELSSHESLTFLHKLAPTVVEQEFTRAQDLVQAVGCLPLALTLMGNYLRMYAYSKQPRRIQTTLEHLSHVRSRLSLSEAQTPGERSTSLPVGSPISLQSAIAVTDQHLSSQTRRTLYALSVFPPKPNTFSEEAALFVADCSEEDLDALVDAGVLESSGSDRYTLHQVLADYACLQREGTCAQERLIGYAIQYLESHLKEYELLERESHLLVTALEYAEALGKKEALIRCTYLFIPYLLSRGFYALAELHLQRAHVAADSLSRQDDLFSILLYQGKVLARKGQLEEAERVLLQGLALARHLDCQEGICDLLTELGAVVWKQGRYRQADVYLQEGIPLARQFEHKECLCKLLKMRGIVAAERTEFTLAEVYLFEGLALARELNDREQTCALLLNLGVAMADQARFAQAKRYLLESLTLARELGHREHITSVLVNLGFVYSSLGDLDKAMRFLLDGLQLARQIERRETLCALLQNLAMIALKRNMYGQAEEYVHEAVEVARATNRLHLICSTLYVCGDVYLRQMRINDAEKVFHDLLSLAPRESNDLIALARYGLARIAAIRGRLEEARRLGEASMIVLEAIRFHIAPEVRQWLDGLQQQTF